MTLDMAPPTSTELLGQSVAILLKHLKWSDATLGTALGKSRQWVYKLTRGQAADTGLSNIDRICAVFSEALGYVLLPSDLLQPDILGTTLQKGVTRPDRTVVNSPSPEKLGTGRTDATVVAQVGRLERELATTQAFFLDVYAALRRHFVADHQGHVRVPQATSAKRPKRSGGKNT